MTKQQILALGVGRIIELPDGSIARVISVHLNKELVEFEYTKLNYKPMHAHPPMPPGFVKKPVTPPEIPVPYGNPGDDAPPMELQDLVDLSAESMTVDIVEEPHDDTLPPVIDPPPIDPKKFGMENQKTVVICDWRDLVSARLL
jgi:hypothetical protein